MKIPENSSAQEQCDKTQSEEHCGVQTKPGAPQGPKPTEDQQKSRNSQRGGEHRKNKRRIRIQSTCEHMLAPNAKSGQTQRAQPKHRHTFAPKLPARINCEHVCYDAETR